MKLDRGWIRTVRAGTLAVCAALLTGCGIYTVEVALTPPSGISMSSFELNFTGDNKSEFAAVSFEDTGYMLWFKEKADEFYRNVQFNGTLSKPTIPITEIPPTTSIPGVTDDDGDPIVKFTVRISNMEHPDSNKNFIELKDEGHKFFFAVSAAGVEGLASDRVEFGQWPP